MYNIDKNKVPFWDFFYLLEPYKQDKGWTSTNVMLIEYIIRVIEMIHYVIVFPGV